MNKQKKSYILDVFGVSASFLCALHCSLLPLAIASGLLSNVFMAGHGVFEMIFIVISVGLAFFSLYQSFVRHGNFKPLMSFGAGLLLIIIGFNVHGMAEIILATTGGLIIAYAHLHNIKLNRTLA